MLNQVAYTGRLVETAKLKIISEKSKVSNFVIAVDRDYKKNGVVETDFFPIVAWNLPIWIIDNYLNKGMAVTVTGSNNSRSYEDNDGDKKYVIELIADHVYPIILPTKKMQENQNGTNNEPPVIEEPKVEDKPKEKTKKENKKD